MIASFASFVASFASFVASFASSFASSASFETAGVLLNITYYYGFTLLLNIFYGFD